MVMEDQQSKSQTHKRCPKCGSDTLKVSKWLRKFTCATCGEQYIATHGKSYTRFRLICCAVAVIWFLWKRDWADSSNIFFLAFCILVATNAWDIFIEPFFPKHEFELQRPAFPTPYSLTGK
jgi:hypothetical protein